MDNSQPEALILDEKALGQGDKKKWLTVANIIRLILLLIIAVIPLEVYFGYQYLKSEQVSIIEKSSEVKITQPVGESVEIFLIPQKEDIKVGDQLNINLKLATFGRSVSNVTSVIKYDPKLIDLVSEDPFTKGEVYTVNPLITKNALAGTIRISGQVGTPADGYTGVGIMGILRFKVKKAGNINISLAPESQAIDYLTGKNILGKTSSVSLAIQ